MGRRHRHRRLLFRQHSLGQTAPGQDHLGDDFCAWIVGGAGGLAGEAEGCDNFGCLKTPMVERGPL